MIGPRPPARAAIKTLGCKLNQYESEQIREQLERRGWCIVPFEGPADLYVINSCTVTSRTDRDCRRLARHARDINPQATVVVTGCYAQVMPERLAAMPEVDVVLGNDDKRRLAELASASALTPPTATSLDEPSGLIQRFSEHTRAFIKVQEGCDGTCAYCVIPRARGPSRSVPVAQVIVQAERLIAAGHPELVLIGTHLGRYGADLDESFDLAALCERLCEIPGLGRLRLSSIEPLEVSDRLIELVATGGAALEANPTRAVRGKLCRHLHIPLQSGCDETLARMRRPYDTARYAALVERIYQACPALGIGADVIAGFPGESEAEFSQTVAFIERLPLAYLHVFTYSPRPGTAAATMPGQVQGEVKKRRNHVLRELSERKRQEFARSLVGQRLEVVVERRARDAREPLRAITDNYLEARLHGPDSIVGRIVPVRVIAAEGSILVGELGRGD